MLIAYASRTGNVRRFVNKLKMDSVQITPGLKINEPFVVVTYTTGFGKVPEQVLEFLTENYQNLKAVAASGNRNWGNLFAKSADVISLLYNVPIISKFEMSGTHKEVDLFIEGVSNLEAH